MPISDYFQGSGRRVMRSMRKKYGAKKGKQVFYATTNKKKSKPVDLVKKHMGGR